MEQLRGIIRDIPDFPKKGIVFKDITTLLSDARSFHRMIDLLAHRYLGEKIDQIVGIEARGFILGSALAYKLGTGITLVRKPGKLPYKTRSVSYDLEYGSDTLEIHEDAFTPGAKIIVADDLLATGGTMAAVVDLVQQGGGIVHECAFMAELEFLGGRTKLPEGKVYSLLKF
ncbi:MAG: adenine phosphoribosyltransferase [Deltaproteobacteria bacterium]|nr:adenine phosphoribosyltransferase [Deltaproteobacteria bacterium]NCP02470.1 adenine phosphoribosyltransferase [Deltaproteobacteria bacterium]NCP78009.1 adenine phosphoribosyltransferase [Desulfuromonadales bacterium]